MLMGLTSSAGGKQKIPEDINICARRKMPINIKCLSLPSVKKMQIITINHQFFL